MKERPRILVSHPGDYAEEDCACPDGGFIPLLPGCATTDLLWRTPAALYRAPLPDGYDLVFDSLGFSNVVVLNAPARAILDAFRTPRPLDSLPMLLGCAPESIAYAIEQLIALGLLHPAGVTPQPLRAQPHTLTAWLHVTNACNLRCTYCYLDKTDEPMEAATGHAAVEAVFRSARLHGFRAVKLKYAGGEATLNFALVRTLHYHAADLAAASGLALHEVVLSNGVALSRDKIAFLRDNGIRLMLSLDGVGAAHDAQRSFPNGHGSFAHVARAVERALGAGVRPDLSITVTGHSAAMLPEAIAFALDRDLPFSLNFYRENDCSARHADLVADQVRLVEGMRAAFAVIEARLPRRRLLDGLVDRSAFDQPHEYACGAGHNYLVIDQRGGVATCQMEIERTTTDVHVEDPLAMVRRERRGFQNVPVGTKQGCRECNWRYWCAGGCPLLTFRATGRTDVRSPYCDVYRALYPEALRLEGLRLLKWAGVEA